MNCQEVHKFIHAYLDGELDEKDWAVIALHMETCESCRNMAQFEEQFRACLQKGLQPVSAPPSLQDRVLRALDEEERSSPAGGWQQRKKWLWRLMPVAAAVALALGVTFSQPKPLSPLSTMVEQSVQWHRTHLPMDVEGSNPEQVQSFFRDKVPFAVRPPSFNQRARLVGARLSNLREHQAVYLTYQVDNQRVSVFIFDSNAVPRDASLPASHITRVGNRKVYWRGVRGYNVAFYQAGGTGYAVTSDMDPQRLIQLISHSR